MRSLTWVILLVVWLVAADVRAAAVQNRSPKPTWEEANALFQTGQWEQAARAFEAITEREPANGQAWLQLAISRRNSKQYQRAIAAYEQAEKLSVSPLRTRYGLAATYALLGEKDKAFQWLGKAIESGFVWAQLLKTDASLASLQSDPRFAEIVAQTEKNARPCDYDPLYRQFDFWAGEWDVYAQGQLVGTNVIQRILNECVIFENWTSTIG